MSRNQFPNGRVASATEVAQVHRSVEEVKRALMRGGPQMGRIGQHYQDVKHFKPEVAQVDILKFQASVTAAGVVTQPEKQSLPGGYIAQLKEVRGYMQKPGTDPELPPLITFNIKDHGRGAKSIFTTDPEMAHLVDTSGCSTPIVFEDGLYVFDGGHNVEVKFSLDTDDTTGYAAEASESKKWGVALLFNLFSV